MTNQHDTVSRAFSLAVHELRTPVTVVSGYLRMLLREQAGTITDKQRRMIEEAERSCTRLGALVTEMSELGKLESGELALAEQAFDLAPVVSELAANMQEGKDRGVMLELAGINRAIVVRGDRHRIAAAIEVLMRAALRERGEPGTVVTACSAYPHEAPTWAVVAIGDADAITALTHGIDHPSAFDEWRGGLGLGLPIARRVIDAHGGALWSVAGGGSRAASALRLPLHT